MKHIQKYSGMRTMDSAKSNNPFENCLISMLDQNKTNVEKGVADLSRSLGLLLSRNEINPANQWDFNQIHSQLTLLLSQSKVEVIKAKDFLAGVLENIDTRPNALNRDYYSALLKKILEQKRNDVLQAIHEISQQLSDIHASVKRHNRNGNIHSGTKFTYWDILYSKSGNWSLYFDSLGYLTIADRKGNEKWKSKIHSEQIELSYYGELLYKDSRHNTIWKVNGNQNSQHITTHLALDDDGYLRLYDEMRNVLWISDEHFSVSARVNDALSLIAINGSVVVQHINTEHLATIVTICKDSGFIREQQTFNIGNGNADAFYEYIYEIPAGFITVIIGEFYNPPVAFDSLGLERGTFNSRLGVTAIIGEKGGKYRSALSGKSISSCFPIATTTNFVPFSKITLLSAISSSDDDSKIRISGADTIFHTKARENILVSVSDIHGNIVRGESLDLHSAIEARETIREIIKSAIHGQYIAFSIDTNMIHDYRVVSCLKSLGAQHIPSEESVKKSWSLLLKKESGTTHVIHETSAPGSYSCKSSVWLTKGLCDFTQQHILTISSNHTQSHLPSAITLSNNNLNSRNHFTCELSAGLNVVSLIDSHKEKEITVHNFSNIGSFYDYINSFETGSTLIVSWQPHHSCNSQVKVFDQNDPVGYKAITALRKLGSSRCQSVRKNETWTLIGVVGAARGSIPEEYNKNGNSACVLVSPFKNVAHDKLPQKSIRRNLGLPAIPGVVAFAIANPVATIGIAAIAVFGTIAYQAIKSTNEGYRYKPNEGLIQPNQVNANDENGITFAQLQNNLPVSLDEIVRWREPSFTVSTSRSISNFMRTMFLGISRPSYLGINAQSSGDILTPATQHLNNINQWGHENLASLISEMESKFTLKEKCITEDMCNSPVINWMKYSLNMISQSNRLGSYKRQPPAFNENTALNNLITEASTTFGIELQKFANQENSLCSVITSLQQTISTPKFDLPSVIKEEFNTRSPYIDELYSLYNKPLSVPLLGEIFTNQSFNVDDLNRERFILSSILSVGLDSILTHLLKDSGTSQAQRDVEIDKFTEMIDAIFQTNFNLDGIKALFVNSSDLSARNLSTGENISTQPPIKHTIPLILLNALRILRTLPCCSSFMESRTLAMELSALEQITPNKNSTSLIENKRASFIGWILFDSIYRFIGSMCGTAISLFSVGETPKNKQIPTYLRWGVVTLKVLNTAAYLKLTLDTASLLDYDQPYNKNKIMNKVKDKDIDKCPEIRKQFMKKNASWVFLSSITTLSTLSIYWIINWKDDNDDEGRLDLFYSDEQLWIKRGELSCLLAFQILALTSASKTVGDKVTRSSTNKKRMLHTRRIALLLAGMSGITWPFLN